MEFLEAIGKPAEYIIAIVGVIGLLWAGIKYVPKGYRWLSSWTFVKREELAKLREVEPKYRKCEADLKTLTARYAPYKEQLERELDKRYGKLDEPSPNDKDQEFTWHTFLWLLKEKFWLNYHHISAGQASDPFLAEAIHGPLCKECKRDVGENIEAGTSVCSCSKTFKLPSFFAETNYPVQRLRRQAYAEAQAAARRKEFDQ